jgi:phosphate transport system substrate-binding protein
MKNNRNILFVAMVATMMILAACGTQPMAATTSENTKSVAVNTPEVATTLAPGSVTINGAGATFPLPLYTEWTYAYQYVDPSVVINYQGIGSGAGKKAIIDNTVDFAGSDSLVKPEEYTAGVDLQMYPIVAGAVVPVYNISFNIPATGSGTPTPQAPAKLILDRLTLVRIYNGTIQKWDDPQIVALNPDLDSILPDAPITVVHRSDGSGTTELFTKALTSFSPEWTAGGASSVDWPADKTGNGVGAKGNPGVAAAVISTPNSIGYVELAYAISNGMNMAKMINKAGTTVSASGDTVNSAMADFATTFTPELTNTIVDAPGTNSWPIAGYTYVILHTTSMNDCVKAQKIVEYIRWTLTDSGAAQAATNLGYSVLPANVLSQVLAKLSEVTCNGQLVLK